MLSNIVIGRKFLQRACELAFAMSGKEALIKLPTHPVNPIRHACMSLQDYRASLARSYSTLIATRFSQYKHNEFSLNFKQLPSFLCRLPTVYCDCASCGASLITSLSLQEIELFNKSDVSIKQHFAILLGIECVYNEDELHYFSVDIQLKLRYQAESHS